MNENGEFSWQSRLARYFLHGITFSILFLVFGFISVVLLALLVIIGYIIGLIVGFILFFFFVGGVNTFLTDFIWSARIRSGWGTLFIHGVGLFFILFIVGLPSYLFAQTSPSLATSVIVFIVYAFIDGFIAKNVAFLWKQEFADELSEEDESKRESAVQRSRSKEEEPGFSAEAEEVDPEELYDRLMVEYTKNWGVQTGAQLLNNEIKAYTWQGETFAEAVRIVYERQLKTRSK